MNPVVSVLLPTFRRPDLVERAARSALGQTLANIEVIVVVDGRDYATVRALYAIGDRRLRVLMPGQHLGSSGARNVALAAARGTWIALLNDEDEWLPGKLAVQVAAAERSSLEQPIMTCRAVTRPDEGSVQWPRRAPQPDEPLSEYLFCRAGTGAAAAGMVPTSTLLARRTVFQRVHFTPGVRRYAELEWLLRAASFPGFGLEFVTEPEPLVVWTDAPARERIGHERAGAYALRWARQHRTLLTPRAYAGFLLTLGSSQAAHGGEWRLFLPLLREARRGGEPSLADMLAHLQHFAIPDELLRLPRRTVGRVHRLASSWGRSPSSALPVTPPARAERQ